ncbi:MAG: proton-conducting transporter membrane subunit [Anaerolineaceae bacterium]
MTLSTPVIWVIFPLVAAAICILLSGRPQLSLIIASAIAFGLAVLAAFLPHELSLGPLTIVIEESLRFLGRRITLVYAMLPLIALLYAATGLWLLSSNLPGVPKTFRPISLVVTAALTAALGVEPFLYAALLIETMVLVSVPMLSSSTIENRRAVLRFLSLITLAMPFILIAGWLLIGVDTLPPDSPLIAQSAIVLGLGFAIWLAVFPFHSWVPMISQHSHPTVFSFLFFILPTGVLVFGLNFFNRYGFLRTSETLFNIIRLIGVLMIVYGGVSTAVQDHLKRAFGFSVLVETGFSLLAISSASSGGIIWMLMMLPPRALGYWLWGYTLARLESRYGEALNLKTIQGQFLRIPFLSSGLILAQFSIAGMPLLASFPIKIALLSQVLAENMVSGLWSFFGGLGLFIFTIRLLLSFHQPIDIEIKQPWFLQDKFPHFLPIILTVVILFISGLFPGKIFPSIIDILAAFPQLQFLP